MPLYIDQCVALTQSSLRSALPTQSDSTQSQRICSCVRGMGVGVQRWGWTSGSMCGALEVASSSSSSSDARTPHAWPPLCDLPDVAAAVRACRGEKECVCWLIERCGWGWGVWGKGGKGVLDGMETRYPHCPHGGGVCIRRGGGSVTASGNPSRSIHLLGGACMNDGCHWAPSPLL